MTPRRAIDVRRRAVTDLAAAAIYITDTTSPASAARWRQRIEAAINELADDADRWREADDTAELGVDLRCRSVGRRRHVYRIVFMIEDSTQTVHVLRVRHAAQDRLSANDI